MNGLGAHSGGGSYRRITFEGGLGAHAIAAWVADNVCFFNPNFGEFSFDSRVKFRRWFLNVFWDQSLYSKILGGRWQVTEYSEVAKPSR